jgi:hypothetical protein
LFCQTRLGGIVFWWLLVGGSYFFDFSVRPFKTFYQRMDACGVLLQSSDGNATLGSNGGCFQDLALR